MSDLTFERIRYRPASREAAESLGESRDSSMRFTRIALRRSGDDGSVSRTPPASTGGRRVLGSRELGRSPLAVAFAMFAVVFALRLAVDDSSSGLSLLFSIPIVLVSIAYGALAGAAAATIAAALVFAWMQLRGIEFGAVGLGMRALVFYAVPATVWLAHHDAARSETSAAEPTTPKPLTRRESEVLALLAVGHTNAEIADKLVLSVRTVESHRANLQRKLGRPSHRELVSYAQREGLLPGARRIPF
jgi:DNA-binding CsgD family transcriptional regulator